MAISGIFRESIIDSHIHRTLPIAHIAKAMRFLNTMRMLPKTLKNAAKAERINNITSPEVVSTILLTYLKSLSRINKKTPLGFIPNGGPR